VASDRTALPIWPADGRAGATPWRHGPADRLDGMPPPARLERLDLRQPAEPVGAVDAGRNESSRGDESSRGAVSTRSARPSHSTEAEPATWLPARTLIGRDVLALDHPVGRLQDLVFDDLSWAVRYLIVALNDRGPTPRRVLVGIDWLDRESAPLGAAAPPDHPLRLALSATQLRLSPGFEDVGSIDAALEQRLPVRTPHRVAMAAAGG
jgi:hypothetical protein